MIVAFLLVFTNLFKLNFLHHQDTTIFYLPNLASQENHKAN